MKVIIDAAARANIEGRRKAYRRRKNGSEREMPNMHEDLQKPGYFPEYGPPSTWLNEPVGGGSHRVIPPHMNCPQCDEDDCPFHDQQEIHANKSIYFRARDIGFDVKSLSRSSHWDVPESLVGLPRNSIHLYSDKWIDRWRDRRVLGLEQQQREKK